MAASTFVLPMPSTDKGGQKGKPTWHKPCNILYHHRHTPPQHTITTTASIRNSRQGLLLPATVLD
jgi:hypothetical protein